MKPNTTSRFTALNSAILLIDHQVGTMQLIKNLPLDRVKRHTLALAKTAAALKIPTVLTSSQEDRFQGPLMPELEQILPVEFAARIKRQGMVNCWDQPEFVAAVRATGRTHLIMAGVTTDVCLIYPSISAVQEGFHVQAVMDASGSPFELSERLAQQRMADAGVVLTATNTLMAELAQDWSSPTGAPIMGVMMEDVLGPVLVPA
jgi:nicotinamidase-related amidase